jgi:hypothetical protein
LLNSEGFATVDVELTWFKQGLLWVHLPAASQRKPVSEARVKARVADYNQNPLKLVS